MAPIRQLYKFSCITVQLENSGQLIRKFVNRRSIVRCFNRNLGVPSQITDMYTVKQWCFRKKKNVMASVLLSRFRLAVLSFWLLNPCAEKVGSQKKKYFRKPHPQRDKISERSVFAPYDTYNIQGNKWLPHTTN